MLSFGRKRSSGLMFRTTCRPRSSLDQRTSASSMDALADSGKETIAFSYEPHFGEILRKEASFYQAHLARDEPGAFRRTGCYAAGRGIRCPRTSRPITWRRSRRSSARTRRRRGSPPASGCWPRCRSTATVQEAAAQVHRDFAEHLKYARLVRKSDEHDGLMVERTHPVEDEDILEFHMA